MAWTAPATATAGSVLTAAFWNQQVRDNMLEAGPSKITVANAILVSTAANTLAERVPSETELAIQETTASTTYTDLATGGPGVTVTTGTKALVIVHCALKNSAAGNQTFMSWGVTGASTIAADDGHAVRTAVAEFQEFSAANLASVGLNAGVNTFTAKYRVSAGTGTYSNRRLIVIPL